MSLIGHAWSIIGAMIGCPLAGYVIGLNFGNDTLGVLIGSGIGFTYCFYELWKFVQKNK
jgi:hypothetical protein